jgi:phage shock protein A
MPYSTTDARRQLLETIAQAAEALGAALASLSEAYEQLDEGSAERVESELFRPVQLAYGRARSAYTGFAERHRLAAPEFAPAARPAPSHGVKELIETAVGEATRADETLATLQDSLLPVEVGDEQLRAGIAQVRELLEGSTARARALLRTFGR